MSFLNKMALSNLSASIALVSLALATGQAAYALESVSDQALSDVTGADGIAVNVQASQVNFNTLYWRDTVNQTGGTGDLTLAGASLTNGFGNTKPIQALATINTGSTSSIPALNLNLKVYSSLLFTAPTITVCTTLSTCTSPTSFGSLAVQTTDPANSANPTTVLAQPSTLANPSSLTISTTNGFFKFRRDGNSDPVAG